MLEGRRVAPGSNVVPVARPRRHQPAEPAPGLLSRPARPPSSRRPRNHVSLCAGVIDPRVAAGSAGVLLEAALGSSVQRGESSRRSGQSESPGCAETLCGRRCWRYMRRIATRPRRIFSLALGDGNALSETHVLYCAKAGACRERNAALQCSSATWLRCTSRGNTFSRVFLLCQHRERCARQSSRVGGTMFPRVSRTDLFSESAWQVRAPEAAVSFRRRMGCVLPLPPFGKEGFLASTRDKRMRERWRSVRRRRPDGCRA